MRLMGLRHSGQVSLLALKLYWQSSQRQRWKQSWISIVAGAERHTTHSLSMSPTLPGKSREISIHGSHAQEMSHQLRNRLFYLCSRLMLSNSSCDQPISVKTWRPTHDMRSRNERKVIRDGRAEGQQWASLTKGSQGKAGTSAWSFSVMSNFLLTCTTPV